VIFVWFAGEEGQFLVDGWRFSKWGLSRFMVGCIQYKKQVE